MFNTYEKAASRSRMGGGKSKEAGMCLVWQIGLKNQEINCEINDKLGALNKEKYIQCPFYVWFNVIYVKGQNVAEMSQTYEDK